MTGVDLTADQSTGSRAQDNGKDQSWPRAAADSSRPRKESLLQSSTRCARFPGGPVLADRSVHSTRKEPYDVRGVINRNEDGFTVQITVPYNRSMLDFEETLQQQLNAAGVLATHEGLREFDTDGSPITLGSMKLTSRGQLPKDYQTPYGTATVDRHVYQSPQGGATYCPLDRDARIIVSWTPKFAKTGFEQVRGIRLGPCPTRSSRQPRPHHSRCLVQDVADAVAAVALVKEEDWSYHLPKMEMPPATVALSLDGPDVDTRERLAGDDGGNDQFLRPRG